MKRIIGGSGRMAAPRNQGGKVRIGVVGAGVFGGYHAQKFAASIHTDFVGVFDKSQEAARAVLAKVGQGELFSSFEALCEACDAVVIATPASTHAMLTRKALLAGKHALVEKPLALSGVEARELAGLALERNLILQVGHQERLVFKAMGLMDTPERPTRVEAVRAAPRSPQRRCEDVSVVFDLMIHDLDLAAELFGGDAERIDSRGHSVFTNSADEAVAELTFATGSAKLTASRCASERERTMRIVYPSGVVEIDMVTRKLTNTTAFDIRLDVSDILPDPLGAADEAFIAAIRGGAVSPITGGVGARAAALAELVDVGAMEPAKVVA